MCGIVGINPLIPQIMNSNSGGAQYIMKNVDASFWEKVEKDSEELFNQITELNNQKKTEDPTYHELQIWCADMLSMGHKRTILQDFQAGIKTLIYYQRKSGDIS